MRPTLFLPACFQLAATVLLAIVPVTFATPSSAQLSPREVDFRDLKPLGDGPWIVLGCFMNNRSQPTLTSFLTSDPGMTVIYCLNLCFYDFLQVAGLGFGQECVCGNVTTAGSKPAASSSLCDVPCGGDSDQTCGGNDTLSVYVNSDHKLQSPAAIVQNVGPWSFLGCYHDDNAARTLTVPQSVIGGQYNNTVENCINACGAASYAVAGMESAGGCWCDHFLDQRRLPIDSSSCMLPCPGDNREICGGPDSLVVYGPPKHAPP